MKRVVAEQNEIVAEYVAEVTRLAKTGKTTEHSFRGALASLIDALAPGLKAVNEPKRTVCGAPDYIVQDRTGLAVFYVEAKDLGDGDLDGKKRTGHKEQFDRYKAALDTIIFTDYLDFRLYWHGQFVSAVRIADLGGPPSAAAADARERVPPVRITPLPANFDDLARLIADAADRAPQRIDSAKRLAELMAGKARMLQSAALAYLERVGGTSSRATADAQERVPPAAPLLDMMLDMRKLLMPEVGADEFSDIFAQTLTYGMFAARLNDPTPETFSRAEAMMLIPKSNPFLKKLFGFIASDLEDELTWIVDDLADLFRAANVADIMQQYSTGGSRLSRPNTGGSRLSRPNTGGARSRATADAQERVPPRDPMLHFYEDFLAAYDGALRKKRGVWYTPIQVVRFIVAAADWALRTRFGLPDGLADSSKTEIEVEEAAFHGKKLAQKVKKTVHRVQLLDPATGTGTFIAEAVRQVHAKFAGNEGMWPGYAEKDLLPRLNGFELLMASYTMAHIKLDMALRETLGNCGNVELCKQPLTNAELPSSPTMDNSAIPQFHNSTFSHFHNSTIPHLNQRFNVFLTDSLSDWHKELPGGLFASVLGAEQEGADEVKRDIPVMVVVGNPPYSGESQNKGEWIMRLMEDYKVEPGGKERLKERNPKWLNDDYVKFIRLAEHYVEKNGEGIVVYITPHGFLDNPTFRGMRWHLMQTFDEIWTLNLHGNSKKKEVAPDGGKDECVFDIMQGVAITLFVKGGKGDIGDHGDNGDNAQSPLSPKSPKSPSSPVPLCRIHYADLWGKRAAKLAALDNATMDSGDWQELHPTEPMLFFTPKDTAGEAEWNAAFGIAELMPVNSVSVVTANDKVLVASDEHELGKKIYSAFAETPDREKIARYAYRPFDERCIYYDVKKIERPREKVMRHMMPQNIALLTCRQLAGLNWSHVFVAEYMVDDNCVSNKSKERGYVFPLYLYEESMGKVVRRANLDKGIVAKIEKAADARERVPPIDIFDYIYGVLHSPVYRAKFKEFLKSDFPRIPYPKDAAEFARFRDAGRTLRETHLMRGVAPPLSEPTARFPVPGDNVVDKVWFEVLAAKDKKSAETPCEPLCSLWQKENAGRVWINPAQYFDNVPLAAWEQAIGGYNPAEKWLKDRKSRALTPDDLRHYQRIILALAKTAAVMEMLGRKEVGMQMRNSAHKSVSDGERR